MACWCCVQVRHPGVSDAIERDFQTMVWVAHVASQLFPSIRSLRLEETLKQFAAPLHEQVRRVCEVRCALLVPCTALCVLGHQAMQAVAHCRLGPATSMRPASAATAWLFWLSLGI